MRIAIISDSGIQHDARVQRLVKSFAHKGFAVDLFLPNYKDHGATLFENEDVRLIAYTLDASRINKNLFFWKKYSNCIQKVLDQKKQYDFIYVNDYPLLYSGVQLKNQLKVPLIYDTHEIYVETINQFFPTAGIKGIFGKLWIAFNKFLHHRKESRLILKADYVVTVCESFKSFFKKRYGIDAIVVKNCPLDLPQLTKNDLLREHLKLKDSDQILLYQGAFNYSRGLEKLVDASQYFNKNIQLILMGDGPLKPRLVALAKGKNQVHFHPKVPFSELVQYSASADIGILLIETKNRSKELTLPNKVFEYMAAGLPFITNKLPEASRIALEHDCGFVIDDVSPKEIALETNKIFDQNYKKNGLQGRNAIEQFYLWEMDFNKLLNLIQP